MRTVRSYGLACINITDKSICMVKRRNTFAFEYFFYGIKLNKLTTELFNNMTVEEKLDILSLDYYIIARRVHIKYSSEQYLRNKIHFEKNYLQDGGKRLTYLVKNAARSITGVWEIPKGRCAQSESPLTAAMREFHEETCINLAQITVDTSHTFTHSFIDCGVRYEYMYYLAFLNHDVKLDMGQLVSLWQTEITEIMWMTADILDRIVDKRLACSAHVGKLAYNIISASVKIHKNRNRMIKRILAKAHKDSLKIETNLSL